MTDNYPQVLPIQIDRKKLLVYLRLKMLLHYSGIWGILGVMLGMAFRLEELEKLNSSDLSIGNEFIMVCSGAFYGLLIGLGIALFLYLVFHHFPSRKNADSLQVQVEGPYLRIMRWWPIWPIWDDRKLHFRTIGDYAYVQGPLMKLCGVMGIRIMTQGLSPHRIILIEAVQDALAVRDMLSEVDHLRENSAQG